MDNIYGIFGGNAGDKTVKGREPCPGKTTELDG